MQKTQLSGSTTDLWVPSVPIIGTQISFHGLKGDNDDPATMGDDFEKGLEYPFKSYNPQLSADKTDWGVSDLRAVAALVKSHGIIDVVLTGVSLGGAAVLEFIYRNEREKDWPKLNIICATVVCGFDQYYDYAAYAKVKIKAYHAKDDLRVRIGSITNTKNRVVALGGSFELDDTLPAGTGHAAWNYAYNKDYPGNAFDWTVQQVKGLPQDKIELVNKTEIINGARVRYTVDGNVYEHDL